MLDPDMELEDTQSNAASSQIEIPKNYILACGAVAKEIIAISEQNGLAPYFHLSCLPAKYHNYPDKIVPNLKRKIDQVKGQYAHYWIGYADCGTGGALDRMIAQYRAEGLSIERLEGAHCYHFFAGQENFNRLHEDNLGTFYLTDYLSRFFDKLIIEAFKLNKHPELKSMLFGNYTRLVYLKQVEDADLQKKAREAAAYLDLDYEEVYTGYGELASFIALSKHPKKES